MAKIVELMRQAGIELVGRVLELAVQRGCFSYDAVACITRALTEDPERPAPLSPRSIPISRTSHRRLSTWGSTMHSLPDVMAMASDAVITGYLKETFGDEGMTAALIDRLVHRGHIFTTTGDSYRFKESLRRSRQNMA